MNDEVAMNLRKLKPYRRTIATDIYFKSFYMIYLVNWLDFGELNLSQIRQGGKHNIESSTNL